MKEKIKCFFTNKINVIVVTIAVVAIVLIVTGCFFDDIVQNILISLGTNIFTSTILFFLINQRIEKKSKRTMKDISEKTKERTY